MGLKSIAGNLIRGIAGGLSYVCQCCCDCFSSAGTTPAVPSDATKGLVWLEFSSCIGSGAAATVDAPEAASPCNHEGMSGPITAVTLTNSGGGYARLGRVSPTISASVSGGTGATLAVTLSEESEFLGKNCMDVPFWTVASVSVTAGGSGYSDGIAVTFSAAGGDTTVHAASGRAYVEIDEPKNETFTFYSNGSGAVLTASWSALAEEYWAAAGRSSTPCAPANKRTYSVSSIGITNGGSGYAVEDTIQISFSDAADGVVLVDANITVDAVDGNGAITSVVVSGGGGIYAGSLTDELVAVVVNSCVANGSGQYYREDASEPPYVADVTVTVQQEAPSTGIDAVVTATVEDDTASANFGKIASLTLVDGGTGYLNAPAACSLPDKLYFTWGNVTTEVPVRFFIPPENIGYPVQDQPANPYICGEAPPLGPDCVSGETASIAVAYAASPGLECKCGGKLHLGATVFFFCYECDTFQTLGFANKLRVRGLCLRFENDESGCPVGDAVVVGWNVGNLDLIGNCDESCPCDTECDTELAPQVSLLP